MLDKIRNQPLDQITLRDNHVAVSAEYDPSVVPSRVLTGSGVDLVLWRIPGPIQEVVFLCVEEVTKRRAWDRTSSQIFWELKKALEGSF